MSSEEFFSVDGLGEDINRLIAKLDSLDRKVKNEIINKAAIEGAEILLAEQRRIIQGKYPQFTNWLQCGVRQNARTGTTIAWAGYNTETIKEHFEVLIVEFGRPSPKRKNGRDKLGRRIGAVQPYSHIRASIFNKKSEIAKHVGSVLFSEVKKIWEGK